MLTSTNSEKQKLSESQSLIQSDLIYNGKIISLRKDVYYDSVQTKQQYDIVLHPGAVAIIPIDDEENIYFVKQWRRAANEILLELPAGTLEPGEKPAESATRELQEEIGFAPKNLISLGGIYTAPGFSNEFIHLFLAEGLIKSPLKGEDSDYIDVIKTPINKTLNLLSEGHIRDAKTLSGILIYLHYKNRISIGF